MQLKTALKIVHGYKRRSCVMNNQALIENMLDMWLSQKQLEKIKEGWNAFYNDPLKYNGSVVVDMIKLDLQEV